MKATRPKNCIASSTRLQVKFLGGKFDFILDTRLAHIFFFSPPTTPHNLIAEPIHEFPGGTFKDQKDPQANCSHNRSVISKELAEQVTQ